jgi:hypothetical protein
MPALFCHCRSCDAEQTFAPSVRGGSGTCHRCGSPVVFEPDGRAAQLRGVELWEEVEPTEVQQRKVAALEKELGKSRTVEIMAARVIRIGPPVTREEEKHRKRDAKKPGGGELRTDTMQVIQLGALDRLMVHLVVPFSGDQPLAHEFASMIPVSLPTCLYFDRDGPERYKQGQWLGTHGGAADPVVAAAKKVSSQLTKGTMFTRAVAGGTQSLHWALQALPIEGRVLHMMQSPMRGMLAGKFDPEWYLERREAFARFAATVPDAPVVQPYFRHGPKSRLLLDRLVRT